MGKYTFYLGARTPALLAAGEALKARGYPVVERPCPAVTHLLLPVPSFDPDGSIKGGGDLHALLAQLPKNITVLGGNLPEGGIPGCICTDLLQDPAYLAGNAAITAHCTIGETLPRLPVTLQGCPVLVIGWGRIGKCLSLLLKAMGANVTITARKAADRAMAQALGCKATVLELTDPEDYRVIYNTVPAPVLSAEQTVLCRPGCLKIDLASKPGIEAEDVIWARGLPGKDAPESSGKLIAKTAIRLLGKKEGCQ